MDETTRVELDFEFRTLDHSDNSPYITVILYIQQLKKSSFWSLANVNT